MKKVILGAAALAVISLASCKKDNRSCVCTDTDGTQYNFTIEDKLSKKNAKFACESIAGMNSVETDSDGSTYTDKKNEEGSCKLK